MPSGIPVTNILPVAGQLKIQFAAKGTRPPDDIIDVPILPLMDQKHVFYVKTEITEVCNSFKTIVHVVQASSRRYIDDILEPYMDQNYPTVWFRYGIVGGGSVNWKPWEEHIIVGYTIDVPQDQGSASLVYIKTCDLLWKASKMFSVEAHLGQISDIVSNIWQAVGGYKSVIEKTVQDTSGAHKVYYQSPNVSYLDFLKNKLLMRSSNINGFCNYRFYVREGALHYHTPAYSINEVKQIRYSAGAPGVKSLKISDRVQDLSRPVLLSSYDPIEGTGFYPVSKANDTIKFAEYTPAHASLPDPGGVVMAHIGQNLADDEHSISKSAFSLEKEEAFLLEVEINQVINLYLGDIINLILIDGDNSSIHSGIFMVSKLLTTITASAITTLALLVRGDLNIPEPVIINDPNTAPQEFSQTTINVKDIVRDNAAVTRYVGSNTETSDKVTVIIQNPSL